MQSTICSAAASVNVGVATTRPQKIAEQACAAMSVVTDECVRKLRDILEMQSESLCLCLCRSHKSLHHCCCCPHTNPLDTAPTRPSCAVASLNARAVSCGFVRCCFRSGERLSLLGRTQCTCHGRDTLASRKHGAAIQHRWDGRRQRSVECDNARAARRHRLRAAPLGKAAACAPPCAERCAAIKCRRPCVALTCSRRLNDGMQENAIIRFNEQVSSEQAVRVLNGFCYLSVESHCECCCVPSFISYSRSCTAAGE
jgi:hypothetical protein